MRYRTIYLVILDLTTESMSLFIDMVSTIKCYGFRRIVKVLIISNYINTCLVCPDLVINGKILHIRYVFKVTKNNYYILEENPQKLLILVLANNEYNPK